MPILGAHMSVVGGFYKAVDEAHRCGCDCVQIFTKNNNQWRAVEITDEAVEAFQNALKTHGIRHSMAHDSYLINLASPDAALWKRSVDALLVELLRAERLGIPHVVAHPGAYTSSTEKQGLRAIIRALDEIDTQLGSASVVTLLETTTGQGTSIGWKFEHLAALLDGVKNSDRLGVCFDTCHVFAAGYPLAERRDYLATFREFDQTVGVDQIRAFHLNDSKTPLGSRVDRHDHIGRGYLGPEPFAHLLNDRRFRKVPMVLETAKKNDAGKEMDRVNLRRLRGLVRAKR